MNDRQINVGNGLTGPLLHDQLELEQWMACTGSARATSGQWQKGADGFLQHNFSAAYIQRCVELWKIAQKKAVSGGAMWGLLGSQRAVEQVSGEALILVLSNNNHGISRNAIAQMIGDRAEFVLWLMHPKFKGSLHLKHLRLVNGRNLGMKLIKKRLTDSGFHDIAKYRPLTKPEKIKLGTLLLENVRVVTGLIDFSVELSHKGHKRWVCEMTDKYWKFLSHWKHNLQTMRPVWMPMTAPPRPWTKIDDGGYYVTGSTCSTVDWELWPKQMEHAHESVLGSLNHLQSIPFRLDHDQWDLLRNIWSLGHAIGSMPPRHRVERPKDHEYRIAGLGPTAYWQAHYKWKADRRLDGQRTQFILAMAGYERLKKAENLYFVCYQEGRGRTLQRSSQLNYQSNKLVRSALMFERPAPMKGNLAEFAWALGEVGHSKVTDMQLRLNELIDNQYAVIRTGWEPLDYIGYWETAKDPFKFVALCREFARFTEDTDYKTRHVFQLDQCTSCYGHAAALTRDKRLAECTNLIGDSYIDLYLSLMVKIEVHLEHKRMKHSEQAKYAEWWVKSGLIDRKLIKAVVMPVIYGRSYQTLLQIILVTVRDHLNNWLTEDGMKAMDLAKVLAHSVHEVTKEQLPGVNNLSKWLRECARVCLKHNKPPYWITPNGWTVLSYAQDNTLHQQYLEVSGRRMKISCGTEDGAVNARKTYSRLCADYIHSMDAAFLQKFVWHWKSYDYPIVTVHDCIGTSLDKVALLRQELNDQFCRFYSEDWLSAMHHRIQEMTGQKVSRPPIVGDLDLDEIGSNFYLFT